MSQTFHCKTTLIFFPLLLNCFLSFSSIEKKNLHITKTNNVSEIGYLRNPSRTDIDYCIRFFKSSKFFRNGFLARLMFQLKWPHREIIYGVARASVMS